MNIMKLTQAELASTTGSQMLKWLEKKSTTKSEYKRLYEDFKTIIIMQQAGFYEQADARLLQWKHLPMPVEYYTYRLAIASKAGGRRLAKKRFKALPEAIQKHDKLKQWRQAVNQNQWWMAATGVVEALIRTLFSRALSWAASTATGSISMAMTVGTPSLAAAMARIPEPVPTSSSDVGIPCCPI